MDVSVEKTKALLVGKSLNRYVELQLLYKPSEEKEYPDRFWRVHFQYMIEKQPMTGFLCDVDSLEEAIATCILEIPSSTNKYEECNVPDNLSTWKRRKIIIKEYDRRDHSDWKLQSIDFLIQLNSGKYVEDYSMTLGEFKWSMIKIAETYDKLEQQIPFYWDYKNESQLNLEGYPTFEYRGLFFKTSHVMLDQKAVCGAPHEVSIENFKNRDFSHDEKEIKIEMFNAHFFEKDCLAFYNGYMVYNTLIEKSDFNYNDRMFLKNEEIKRLRQAFPELKEISTGYETKYFHRAYLEGENDEPACGSLKSITS